MTFVTRLFLLLFSDLTYDIYDNTGSIALNMYKTVIKVNQTSEVLRVSFYSMLLGSGLLLVAAAKQIICTYGFGTEGDSDQDPIELVYKIAMALGVMGVNSWLFNELLKFISALGDDILTVMGKSTDGVGFVIDFQIEHIESFFKLFLVMIMVIGMVVFAIVTCLRAAELTLSRMLLPIFAVDLLHSNCEKWKMFIFQYVVSFASFILQMICYEMFLIQYYNMSASDIMDYFIVIGWLVVTIKSPAWLEKYIYATGTGQAISRGSGRLGQVVMNVTSIAMRK